jgi:prophage maintenance system killer protein
MTDIDKKGHESMSGGEVLIYYSSDGRALLDVRLDAETVWLTQKQMAMLFDKDSDTVGLHIRNIFKEGELEMNSTTEESSVVQIEGQRSVRRLIKYYNLDVIISVGYRVKSLRGTQFRIWATSVLKEHLVKGYTANEKRLRELRQSIKLIENIISKHDVSTDEAKALLKVVTDYSYALDVLDDYDHKRLKELKAKLCEVRYISYEEAVSVIKKMRERFGASNLFGKEKDKSLHSSLAAIAQTFDGKDVYPGFEEKAANLLYFLVKNHSFVDGNKRIAAALFLWFMEKNGMLYTNEGIKLIADNALVAITLMIAESLPTDKELMVNLVVRLIGGDN